MGRRIPGMERLIDTANSTGKSTATLRPPELHLQVPLKGPNHASLYLGFFLVWATRQMP